MLEILFAIALADMVIFNTCDILKCLKILFSIRVLYFNSEFQTCKFILCLRQEPNVLLVKLLSKLFILTFTI